MRTHDEEQDEEHIAADLWCENGWVFTQPTGKPLDPRADHDERESLLEAASVPLRAIADVTGRSPGSAAQMRAATCHVPDAIREGTARQVGGLLWTEADDTSDLPGEHRAAIRQLSEVLPPRWRERPAEVFRGDGGGSSTGVSVPTRRGE
ncbi:hypothetical protein [Saccharothrix texasensis]|uniref:hypothetical protein n=1 Tax=Saccharothrix texasensis TaxID=103734 RepID=UPI000F4C8365|nr:hypothetical protein [Saccharothrix texasensis]